ncbi:MAG: ParB/RepB/Spo0J family partition protein [Oscillospiraceae bacterium]|nr:ParB/RepB/Spo0J family partition protein [Oscillospiraceae bacterium]
MPDLRNTARGENEWAATYGNLGMVAPVRLMQLPLHVLDPWEDVTGEAQPFQPYTPAMLEDLAENISRNGIIQPINVRPRPSNRFQIIAGHNRVAAAKIAGLTTVPALVQELDDDQAAIQMIDSNLKTRPHILPSERAKAYKDRMDHIQKQRAKGGPMVHPLSNDEFDSFHDHNSEGGPMVHPAEKGKSRDIISEETGTNARQIQRYLRLNELHPDLLKMVDNGALDKEQQDKNIPAMALRAGVELSYIPMEQQELLLAVMVEYGCKAPSMAQAGQLRSLAAAQVLDVEVICSVMVKTKAPKADVLKLPAGRISSLFPPNTLPEQMEAEIYAALIEYRKNQSPAPN